VGLSKGEDAHTLFTPHRKLWTALVSGQKPYRNSAMAVAVKTSDRYVKTKRF